MNRVVVTALLGLCIGAAACSKDVCEEAYEKVQDCVASMDCDALGPALSGSCQKTKKEYALSYTIYLGACPGSCSCEGAEQEKWERINNCSLEPSNLCKCR